MKNVLMAAAICMAGYAAQAQATFGVQANGLLSNTKADYSGDENADAKGRISWKAGVVMNAPLSSHISFRPELNALSKGGIIEAVTSSNVGGQVYRYTAKQTYQLTYIEAPLNVVYNTNGTDRGFFIGAGPSVSYGVGGHIKSESTQTAGGQELKSTTTTKVVFDNKENTNDGKAHYKPLAFGANFIAGYNVSDALFFNLLYNYGFTNIHPGDAVKMRNSYLGLGVGVFF